VPFASIKLDKTTDLQTFSLKDSVLLSYFRPNAVGGGNFHGGVIVRKDGSYRDFSLEDVATQLCGSELKDEQLFLYFIEKKKNRLVLQTLKYNKENNSRKILDDGIIINGRLIGVDERNGISVFSWNSSDRTLFVYRVSGGEHTENSYQLPTSAMFLEEFDFQVMPTHPGWLYQSNAKAKIYYNDQQVKVTLDRKFRTEIISFNKGEKNYEVTTIGEDMTKGRETAVGSFLCDSLLFRMDIPDNGVRLSIFTVKDGLMISSRILYAANAGESETTYFHSGKEDVTHHQEKLKRLMLFYGIGARPSIIANKLKNGNYCVTLGSFYNQKGTGIVASANPVTLLVGSFVMTAIKQARKAPGASRYIYTNVNGKAIDFQNEPSIVFKAIDDFDISKPKGSTIEDVLVEDAQNAILAFHDLNSQTLQLIRVHSE